MDALFTDVRRFDVFAKYIYVKHKDMKITGTWFNELYDEDILTMNGGWEYPGDKKTKIEDFRKSFDELIKSVKEKGFVGEPILISAKKGLLENGVHRLAICNYLKKDFETRKTENEKVDIYNYKYFTNSFQRNYFRNREQAKNLSQIWMDRIALEMVEQCRNIFVVTIFPVADIDFDYYDRTIELLDKDGRI
jgi:hypothetical protein